MINKESIEFLKNNIAFYNSLDKDEQVEFNSRAIKSTFYQSEFPLNSDRDCHGLIIVISGMLRASLNSVKGKEITLYKLLSRDTCIFSSSCIFNNINFEVSIEAIEETEVIILPSTYVNVLSKRNIIFQGYLLQLTQSRMSEVMAVMEGILFTSLEDRLKEYLIEHSLNEKTKVIKLTHDSISKDLGTAREVISRMLKQFEKKGVVKLSRGKIELVNL